MRLVQTLLPIGMSILVPTAHCYQSVGAAPREIVPVPLAVRYRFFFRHLETMDIVADDMDKKLQNSALWRSHDQRASGLTIDEWNFVHATALKCRADLAKNDAAIQQRLAKQPQEFDPVIANLREQRTLLVESAINTLQKHLGEVEFAKLTQFITTAFPVTIVPQPLTPPISIPSQAIQTKGSNQ